VRRAFVENHDDIGCQRVLHVDRALGRELDEIAVDRRPELDAALTDLTQRFQTENLESTRIGQDRARPIHEPVQPAVRANDLCPRTQHQVEGIAEDDFASDCGQLVRCHGLHRAVSADRHESRRLDGAALERQSSATSRTIGCHELKPHVQPLRIPRRDRSALRHRS
jgi:hypothetical protein